MSAGNEKDRLLALENRVFALETILGNQRNGGGDTFEQAVIRFFIRGIARPMFQHYVRYALKSLERGEKLVELYKPTKGRVKRYLDVGCAYGGAVIAMVRAGVRESIGIDVDQRLIDLARIQARQLNVESKTEFATADIADKAVVDRYGHFDLITCIDVLEHVLDPDQAIVNLGELADRSATVIVDVPNPSSYQLINQDPHHHLFGSILLERDEAIKVFQEHNPANKRYTVGYFHELEWYLERLERVGLAVDIMDEPSQAAKLWPETRRRFEQLLPQLERTQQEQQWSDWRRTRIAQALTDRLEAFRSDVEQFADPVMLHRRYGIPVYHLRCRKRT